MLLLERPKTISTSVIPTPAISEKKLTAKWIVVNQELVYQWIVE
jgi:hypothetical protein